MSQFSKNAGRGAAYSQEEEMSDEESSNQDELSDRQANNKRKPKSESQFN